jgi:ankyrin repeat protein
MFATSSPSRDLRVAASQGKLPDVLAILRSGKASIDAVDLWGRTALYRAVDSGHIDVVAALIAAGADVNHVCKYNGPDPNLDDDEFIRRVHGPLKDSLDDSGNHDFEIDTPLVMAARSNNMAIVKALIAGGADVNQPGECDMTPLDEAASRAEYAGFDVVNTLIAAGARPTPLYEAACRAEYAGFDVIKTRKRARPTSPTCWMA